ncbi:MAG: DUF2130 domain-containing protein [Pseudomonadota bacterium]
MSDTKITCPNCAHEFAVSEQLAGPLLRKARDEADARVAAVEQARQADRRAAQKARDDALAEQKTRIEAEAAQAARMAQAEEVARAKAEAAARDEEIAALKAAATVQSERLAQARATEKAALAKEAELEERAAEMDVEIARKLSQERKAQEEKLRAQVTAQMAEAQAEREEEAALRLVEKDQQMETLKRQIEVLKQKAEKGSQQLQGEALEVALEDRLAQAFPGDTIAPVGKGVRGADCLQTVLGGGAIIWETKRTQNWSKDWPAKLKTDQRDAGAEVAVLVSVVLPDGVETFAEHDGVWVCAPRFAVALAGVIRQGLIATAQAERRREGQASKTELLYDYLTGTGFRQRVEALAETYEGMVTTLAQEEAAMNRIWKARKKQIERMMDATAGMYGDIQGIAGASLPSIAALELPGLEAGLDSGLDVAPGDDPRDA